MSPVECLSCNFIPPDGADFVPCFGTVFNPPVPEFAQLIVPYQLKVHALFLFFKEFPYSCLFLNKNLASKLARRVVVATGLEPVTPLM